MGFRTSKFMTGMKSKKAFKTLSVAALAGVAALGFGADKAQANEISITPTLGDDASYTLTETTDVSLDNVITKYVYDETNNTLTEKHYQVNLKQTEYGEGDGEKYFQWSEDEATGLYALEENTNNEGQIIAKYDTSNHQVRLNNSADISSSILSGDFLGLKNSGAIYNTGIIGEVRSNYIGNVITTSYTYGHSWGGAIQNYENGKIGNIYGDFVGNQAITSSHAGSLDGGAIYNRGTIGDISGSFISNSVNYISGSTSNVFGGGAIYNQRSMGSITGDFIGNYVSSHSGSLSKGGAIFNSQSASLGDITGDFIGNHVSSPSTTISSTTSTGGTIEYNTTSGGAIFNDGYIGNIKGNFIGNYVSVPYASYGGAIFNDAGIKSITGDFVGNYVYSTNRTKGGAIFTQSSMTLNSSNFYKNYSYSKLSPAFGGAIYTTSSVTLDNSKFISNYVRSDGLDAYGGAISASSSYGTLKFLNSSLFAGNNAYSELGKAYGGALYKYSTPDRYSELADFSPEVPYNKLVIQNEDGSERLAFYMAMVNGSGLSIQQVKRYITLGKITSFVENDVEVIPKEYWDMILEEAKAELGEDASEELIIQLLVGEGLITENPDNLLGQVYSLAYSNDEIRMTSKDTNFENTSFVSNYAESKEGEAKGGAIYAENSYLEFRYNDGKRSLISGNYVKNGDTIEQNAIYANNSKLFFDLTNGSSLQLDDTIDGTNGYEIFIYGDDKSSFILNNDIKNSTVNLIETTLHLVNEKNIDCSNNLNLHSGTLSMLNNKVGISSLNSLNLYGDTNVLVDVDLKNQTMDRFTASEYGSHSGNLNVTGMNLLSDAVSDKTSILFAEKGLKDNVTYGGTELPDGKYQTTAYTPIYKYNVAYDNRDEAGYFVFTKGGKVGGTDSFNPAVLGSSTSATVGATATMNQAFNYAFQNSADYMNIPYLERISMRDRNKYALSITGDATDMGRFSPLYQPSQEEASVWVKPYATFETVGLKNGPKVHNNTYGTLIGFDTEMQSIKRGWDRVFTGYIGYNGASQRYSGIDSTQNGGLLGGTMTLYKGNFFNATTVSVGASVANNQTMYGNEDFAMLLSGIGNKTGYNFEFKEGKLILQPSMLMSYTFVNTFDYTNAAGVRIDNKPLHALQLVPGVKVIGNLKGGWQPYASVQMVWNLMGESNATANGVKLPEMSIKPYVQYGVGVQKRIKDHFTAYGQAMVQNGGRNGVSLTAGFRWALGHDNCKYKVEDKQLRGKVDKQLRSDAAKQLRGKVDKQLKSDAAKQLRGNADKQLKSDASKIKRHYEEHSDVVISSNNAIATPSARNDNGRKILKQMTPQQRAAYGGKYYNTTRTAKAGSLRQY